VYSVDAQEGVPKRLTFDAADDKAPAWSHDGAWIYFGSLRSGAWQLWKIPAGGGDAVQVTQHGGYAAQASGDGRYVYYAKQDTAGVWRLPIEGGREMLILDAVAPGDWSNWILTEKGIFFLQRHGPRLPATLTFYEFDTAARHPVAALPRAPAAHQPGLSLSPDGRWLLYTHLDQAQSDLMLVEDFH
jgi:Tol biopolymer transport system component